MNIPRKTKRNTLILTLSVLIISWIVGYLFLEYQFKYSINKQFQRLSNSTIRLFDLKIVHEKKEIELQLIKLISTDRFAQAIANANYKRIKSIISPQYNNLKYLNDDIRILTFRSSNGMTLYRAHKPNFYGDKVSEKRKLIIDTNKLQISLSGFEVGKFDMTYRVTQPIFYQNKYVGNVELGITPTSLIKDLSSIFKMEMGVAINKSLLNIMLTPEFVSINEDFVLLESSNKLKQHYSKASKNSTLFKAELMVPLHNHLRDILGYLVVGFDTSSIIQSDKEFMLKLFFLIVIMMLVLGAVLHQGFELMLKQFTTQVYTDHLTGAKNRLALNDRLYPKENHVLLLSNIKDFSLLNELYGVETGNEILIQIANAFEKFALDYNFDSFRISGDEFVLLIQKEEFDAIYCEQILEKLNSFIQLLEISVADLNDPISIEMHTGLAFNHSHSLEDAQMALKIAKEKSLPYVIYSKHVDTKKRSETIIQMKRTIRHALEHNNIVPFFQPITNCDGKVIKYEALVRIIEFENGEKKILTPNLFLDISMQSGLYIEIAKEMLKKSLSQFAARDEKISVNFLPNDFFNPFIIDLLLDYIKQSNSPEQIVVEITEQEGVEDFDRLVEVIRMLRKLGVLIAIDDFGSGYANYSHILTLKPDYLKIDGSLIHNILTNNESKILVKSIIHFAKELDIITVAEYVENQEIFELLKEYGVDEFQGYYFGRPIELNG